MSLWTMPGPVWVRCPRCSAPARIDAPLLPRTRRGTPRLACARCGVTLRYTERVAAARARSARINLWRPRCDRCGRPVPPGTTRRPFHHGGELRVGWCCPGCGHVSLFPATPVLSTGAEGTDPWFELPLVLRAPVGRHLLWAWNAHHLLLLEEWLGAALRERSRRPAHWSLASRLPGWMGRAAMRPKVIKAILGLRALALAEGIA